MPNRTVFGILILFLIGGCMPFDLSSLSPQIKSIVVYDLEPKKQQYTEETLGQATQTSIQIDKIKQILPRAIHKRSWVLWKGGSLAILELKDGSKIQMAISYYGGFFKVIGTSGYFMFENETDRNEFMKIFGEVVQNKFIPERIKTNKENIS